MLATVGDWHSLRFNGRFPGGPGLTSTRMYPFWISLELRVMEVVVTTGPIRHIKLQSNHHHQQTNPSFFTGRMTFLSPNHQCQSTEWSWRINFIQQTDKNGDWHWDCQDVQPRHHDTELKEKEPLFDWPRFHSHNRWCQEHVQQNRTARNGAKFF